MFIIIIIIIIILCIPEERGSGTATVSTAVFYSLCVQVERFQIVLGEGTARIGRCGNSHSDDGWGPHWDRRLAPFSSVGVQCGSPTVLQTSRQRSDDVVSCRRYITMCLGQSLPSKSLARGLNPALGFVRGDHRLLAKMPFSQCSERLWSSAWLSIPYF